MRGRDLKCPECGEGAKDVAPDYLLNLRGEDVHRMSLDEVRPFIGASGPIFFTWTCNQGHRHKDIA